PKLWRRMFRGSTGLADSYLRKEWDCDDLVELGTIAGLNLPRLDGPRRRVQFLAGRFQRLGLLVPRSTRARGKRQSAAHYDLGNDLFSHVLDESMNDSAAIFTDDGDDLATAQQNKMNRIGEQLDLRPEHH